MKTKILLGVVIGLLYIQALQATSTQYGSPHDTGNVKSTTDVNMNIETNALTLSQEMEHTMPIDLGMGNVTTNEFPYTLAANPARQTIRMVLSKTMSSNTTVQLYDITGNLIYQVPLSYNQQTVSIDVSNLPSGLYICMLISGNARYSHKVVVEN